MKSSTPELHFCAAFYVHCMLTSGLTLGPSLKLVADCNMQVLIARHLWQTWRV